MKFRVLSDLHQDVRLNGTDKPFTLNDDCFTVVCGDTSGSVDVTSKWIRKNIRRGVFVSGNHMPYDNPEKFTMDELRGILAERFPVESPVTYLDALTDCFSKIVDGILFVGTCMYSNMRIKSAMNPTGDIIINKSISRSCMNDYYHGILKKIYPAGSDNTPNFVKVTPDDYIKWFNNAYSKIDAALTENESSSNPLPTVVITHFPLVREFVEHSLYVDADNYASYGNDMKIWLISHPSVKCHCCGHCHDIEKDWRSFYVDRQDGSRILCVNNSMGYMHKVHDMTFNPNRFVNTDTWEIEEIPETPEVTNMKEMRFDKYMSKTSLFF